MKRILLVDDDAICSFLNSKAIERIGAAEIQTAINGKEALDLLNMLSGKSLSMPDTILLDVCMPIMGGFDFLEAFEKLTFPDKKNIRTIMITSSCNPEDIAKARKFGIRFYLNKPVSDEALKSALETLENGELPGANKQRSMGKQF